MRTDTAWPLDWVLSSLTYITTSLSVLTAFALLAVSAVASYRLALHPLSRVPGPRLAAITSAWYAYQIRNGHALQLGRSLHRRYGPVVRVAPNELWFASRDAFRIIYSQSAGTRPSSSP